MNTHLKIIAQWFEIFHGNHDMDFEKILAPYFYLFSHYSKAISRTPTEKKGMNPIYVPSDVGCLLMDFEEKGILYNQLLTFNSKQTDNKWITIGASEKYYKNYVFPFGALHSIAYFSFMSKYERVLFYLLNLGMVERCNFEMQPNSTEVSSNERNSLCMYLHRHSGCDLGWAFAFSAFLPKCYLEDFSFYYGAARLQLDKIIRTRRIYFNRHALFNSNLLFVLGLAARKNIETITFQHGASYGQVEPSWSVLSEKLLCSTFLTWGFKHDEKEEPFFSIRLPKKINILKSKPTKKTLIVLPLVDTEGLFGCMPEVAIRSLTIALSKTSRKRFEIKPHPRNEGSEVIRNILSTCCIPHSKIVTGRLNKFFGEYRFLVFTSPDATGFLEALSEGYTPFMAFHDDDYIIKKESRYIYELMKNNKIWINNCRTQKTNTSPKPERFDYSEFKNNFLNQSYTPQTRAMMRIVFQKG